MLNKLKLNFHFNALMSLLAGGLLAFAFAPFNYYWLAIISPAVLYYCWQQFKSPRQAFFLGWVFGVGEFSVGVSWIYISIHEYGSTPWWFAGGMTILCIAFLSLYPALQGYVLNRFLPNEKLTKSLLAYPASWVLSEWLRGIIFTGFPWLLLGYSQTTSLFSSWAPLGGCYAITFLITFISALIVIILNKSTKIKRVLAVSGVCILIATSLALQHLQFTKPLDQSLKVSLIQGNIKPSLIWSDESFLSTLATYQQLTAKNWGSELIVWPEGAIALPYKMMQGFLKDQDEQAKAHHTTLITGIPFEAEQNGFYYNGMLALGMGTGKYFKQRLVTYAETLPYQSLFQGLLSHFNLPLPNLLSGPRNQTPLTSHDQFIASFICYDIVDSDVVRAMLPVAQLLLTISEDGWFGHSFAQAQHLQIAQMRAIQTGRYHLTVTNNGLTAIIDHQGRITTQLPPFQQGVLTGKAELRTGATPWVMWGDMPVLVLAVVCVMLAVMRQNRVNVAITSPVPV